MSSKAPETNYEEVRIVMVGRTGAGKSTAGNTILGFEAFETAFASESQTMNCQKATAVGHGRNISVVDTPGFFDTRDNVIDEIKQCICFAAPGPHVFLIVIRLGRFTEEEQIPVEMIQLVFGEMSNKYSMILFTGGDLLRGTPVEDFLKKSPRVLQDVIKRCDGRYHVFDNKTEDPSQVTELLGKIESMLEVNGRSHYTTEMFQEAEGAIQEEQQRILKEDEPEIRKSMRKLKKDHEGEALILAETQLKRESTRKSRIQAEKSNCFLSKKKAPLAEDAKKFFAKLKPKKKTVEGKEKCSIQ